MARCIIGQCNITVHGVFRVSGNKSGKSTITPNITKTDDRNVLNISGQKLSCPVEIHVMFLKPA